MNNRKKIDFLKNNKKLLALILGATIGTTMFSGCSSHNKKEDVTSDLKSSGYSFSNCGSMSVTVDEEEFRNAVELTKEIIGDVNNDQFAFVHIYGYCDDSDYASISSLIEEGKEVGLIVSPKDATYGSIYDSVDSIKDLLTRYDINCPIFYNINNWCDDDEYLEANCKLGDAFCSKLAANGCYVGFYGDFDQMEKYSSAFKKYRGKSLDAFDKMILIDYDKLSEIINGNSDTSILFKDLGSLIVLPDGTILSKNNLIEIIEKNNLNEKENFQEDEVYVVDYGDSLSTIAEKYNMVEDGRVRYDILAEYNGYSDNISLQVDDNVVIPTSYDDNRPIYKVIDNQLTSGYYTDCNEVHEGDAFGIDVSDYQNEINWELASNYVNFAIIKVREFAAETVDAYYDYNMSECNRLGIPVGVYYFPRANTVEGAQKEVNEVVERLNKYQIDLPIYLDIEDPDLKRLMRKDGYGVQKFKEIISVAFDTLKANGYSVGLYGDADEMRYIIDDFDCEYWFTQSGKVYGKKVNLSEVDKLEDDSHEVKNDVDEKYEGHICQHSCCGTVPGIEGDVDIDHCSYDYLSKFTGENKKTDNKIKVYS